MGRRCGATSLMCHGWLAQPCLPKHGWASQPWHIRTARLIALFTVLLAAGGATAEPLEMHVVPIPVKSYRLLSMSMDDDGFIWTGSIHRVIHRYDPRNGSVDTIKLPFDAATSACICAGRKVYLLGQAYPKLMVYHRDEKRFTEHPYPTAKPNVWYGALAGDDSPFLYLLDRGSVGVIKWDTRTDTAAVIPWPYKSPLPWSARFEPRDGGLWCSGWDLVDGKYTPLGMARLDPKTDRFTGWYDFPRTDTSTLAPYTNPDSVFFFSDTMNGKLVPFDFRQCRWCKPIDVPRFNERFAFLGASGVEYKGKLYFTISTYTGSQSAGCDGKPYHFCNGLVEFDPKSRTFDFPALSPSGGGYYQVAYTLSARGELFATGVDILQPDGTLDQTKAGPAVFWQTLDPKMKRK